VHGEVVKTEWITPGMLRVVLGGDGLDAYAHVPYTDAYVNIAVPPAGASYAAPFDPERVRHALPPEEWPFCAAATLSIVDVGDQHRGAEAVVGDPVAVAVRLSFDEPV
jgi:NADPH-dependent ferric siderophore reductase